MVQPDMRQFMANDAVKQLPVSDLHERTSEYDVLQHIVCPSSWARIRGNEDFYPVHSLRAFHVLGDRTYSLLERTEALSARRGDAGGDEGGKEDGSNTHSHNLSVGNLNHHGI